MQTWSGMVAGTLAPVAVAQDTMVTFSPCLLVEGPNRGRPAADPAVRAGRLSVALHTRFVSEGSLP